MKKRLLIFSWEYNGYHSVQGTALSKRPRQIAESYRAAGWDVTVVHKDHRNESGDARFHISLEDNGIRRIAVKSTDDTGITRTNPLSRKLETLYYIAFRGDRTYRWATDVIKCFPELGIAKPGHIIGCFSPRVPLYLAKHFAHQFDVQWLADIQDPIYEGVAKKMWPYCRRWMKSVLSSAKAIVHISPEWAEIDSGRLQLPVNTIRHAVPAMVAPPTDLKEAEFRANHGNHFNVFYGGSISPDIQSLDVLRAVIEMAADHGVSVKILLAGNDQALKLFKDGLGRQAIHYLGWLSPDDMNRYIYNSNCTMVIPWSAERVGIPSKLYELCSYPKPIWIVGHDMGALSSLLNEWKHPAIATGDIDTQLKAVLAAAHGDTSKMFNLSACTGQVLKADQLCAAFLRLL